jgi:hypothetical protein
MASKVYTVFVEHDDGQPLPLPQMAFIFSSKKSALGFASYVKEQSPNDTRASVIDTPVFSSEKQAYTAFNAFINND